MFKGKQIPNQITIAKVKFKLNCEKRITNQKAAQRVMCGHTVVFADLLLEEYSTAIAKRESNSQLHFESK